MFTGPLRKPALARPTRERRPRPTAPQSAAGLQGLPGASSGHHPNLGAPGGSGRLWAHGAMGGGEGPRRTPQTLSQSPWARVCMHTQRPPSSAPRGQKPDCKTTALPQQPRRGWSSPLRKEVPQASGASGSAPSFPPADPLSGHRPLLPAIPCPGPDYHSTFLSRLPGSPWFPLATLPVGARWAPNQTRRTSSLSPFPETFLVCLEEKPEASPWCKTLYGQAPGYLLISLLSTLPVYSASATVTSLQLLEHMPTLASGPLHMPSCVRFAREAFPDRRSSTAPSPALPASYPASFSLRHPAPANVLGIYLSSLFHI